MRCPNCFSELPSPTAYCLRCGSKNVLGCGIFAYEDRLFVLFLGKKAEEILKFKLYDDSIRNTFEVLAERLHERRVEEVYVSGSSKDVIEFASENVKRYSLTPISVYITDPFPTHEEFFDRLSEHLRTVRELKKVDIKPEDKIHGAHSTIIGGREGLEFLRAVAKSEYVKKIVPGVIEAKGTAQGGGVRFKLTRCDDRGNIRALLIDGSSVQEIHIVTTARSREEGEIVLRMLRSIVEESR